jgi:hypothetical protein
MSEGGSADSPASGTPDWGMTPQPWPQPDQGQYGQPPGQYPGYQPQPFGPAAGRTNPLAIAAMVCGIGQFLLGLLIIGNILLAIPALVLGVIGLGQTSTRGERGRGMAIAGIVLGALGIVYFALVLLLIILGYSSN